MTPRQWHLVAAMAVLAGLAAGGPASAQQRSGQVLLPWQKPQPQPRPAPDMREILPWLMGEEAAGQQAAADAGSWVAKLDDPTLPIEPVVAEPALAGPRLETGAIVPSGLVLKKPLPVVHGIAAPGPAAKAAAGAGPVGEGPAPAQVAAAPNAPAASDENTIDAAATASPAPMPARDAVTPEAEKADAVTAEPAPPPTAVVPAKAAEAAPAMPEAEEVPAIPEPLPDAMVTPVKSAPAKAETPAEAAAPPAVSTAVPTGESSAPKPNPPKRLADGANAAQQYCFNIADAAKDARYAWQKKTLADIEAELKKRIALLDERTAEYQKWLARRDEFIRTAEDGVVKIYTGMKPDTAATQLALMNEETAAAVLVKLNTRNASAILNEMEPAKAARLTSIITGAARLKRKKQLEQEATAASAGAAGDPVAGGAQAPMPSAAPSDGGRS